MNLMTTVQEMSSEIDAIYDEEEFFVPLDRVERVSDWSPQSLWLKAEPTTVGLLDVAKLWGSDADSAFLDAITRVLASLEEQQPHRPFSAEITANDNQLSLPILGGFTPSIELIKSWKENASSFGDREIIARAKAAEASAEFSRMLKRLLGAFAQEKRYSGLKDALVADAAGEFDTSFQLEISERFLLVPQKSASFFSLLYRDLLKCGDQIYSGGWGSFIRTPDHRLVLELLPPNGIKREGFVKAQEIRK